MMMMMKMMIIAHPLFIWLKGCIEFQSVSYGIQSCKVLHDIMRPCRRRAQSGEHSVPL